MGFIVWIGSITAKLVLKSLGIVTPVQTDDFVIITWVIASANWMKISGTHSIPSSLWFDLNNLNIFMISDRLAHCGVNLCLLDNTFLPSNSHQWLWQLSLLVSVTAEGHRCGATEVSNLLGNFLCYLYKGSAGHNITPSTLEDRRL